MRTEKRFHIIGKSKTRKKVRHVGLCLDLMSNNLFDTFLMAEGKIGDSPETWSIECQTIDGDIVDNYLYESKDEYESDLKLFGLL